MKNGKVLSLINMKGGVGKTTLTVGIADHLSVEYEKSILVIDADPQFNATQALLTTYKNKNKFEVIDDTSASIKKNYDYEHGYEDEENETFYQKEILEKNKTIFHLFQPQMSVMNRYEIPKSDDLIININKNLDLLAGDLNLVLANKNSDYSLVKRLRNFIDENDLRSKYEYILIDCPPTLTIYTDSALLASDYYLIPNRIDKYSIIGIDSLQTAINNLITEERINLKSLGIIYTMVKINLNKKQRDIKRDFESKKAVNNLEIFNSVIHEVNHIQYGVSGPLPTRYKTSKEDIESIIVEMEEKIFQLEGDKYEE
ncbi:MAG: ParA family protein [Staphylococcus saprophyticus]